jgi:hypothetical protein
MKSRQFKLNKTSASAETHISRLIIIMLVTTTIATLLALAGCGKDEKGPETDRVRKLLTASNWKVQSVSIDGTDRTSSFTGLTVKFTDTQFTTTQGGLEWPASGIWTFVDDGGKVIVRGDGIEITIQEISDIKLVMNFNWSETTLGPGRLSSTSGGHVFTFVK